MSRRCNTVGEAAGLMVKRYGPGALQQIDQRIHELNVHGESDAVALWREIRAMAEFLLQSESNEKPH